MMILLCTSFPIFSKFPDPDGRPVHRNLGRLVTPTHIDTTIEKTAALGMPWAADNDCFQRLDLPVYVTMLDKIRDVPGCKFVTVPDVWSNAAETVRYFDLYADLVEKRGLPLALVLQDGVENYLKWLERQWPRITALFVGGTNKFKLGPVAAKIVNEGLRCGKYIHWGRVSSRMRIRYIVHVGGHSFDSTRFSIKIYQSLARALALTLEPPPLARLRINRAIPFHV